MRELRAFVKPLVSCSLFCHSSLILAALLIKPESAKEVWGEVLAHPLPPLYRQIKAGLENKNAKP